jgi:hypothetical protein
MTTKVKFLMSRTTRKNRPGSIVRDLHVGFPERCCLSKIVSLETERMASVVSPWTGWRQAPHAAAPEMLRKNQHDVPDPPVSASTSCGSFSTQTISTASIQGTERRRT